MFKQYIERITGINKINVKSKLFHGKRRNEGKRNEGIDDEVLDLVQIHGREQEVPLPEGHFHPRGTERCLPGSGCSAQQLLVSGRGQDQTRQVTVQR